MIDWQRVVMELREAGWKSDPLAEEIGYHDGSSLRQMVRGNQKAPFFDAGVKLLAIHQRSTGKPIPYREEPDELTSVIELRA